MRPPDMRKPAGVRAFGEGTTGRSASTPPALQVQRLPSDLRFSGVLLDAEHLEAADSLARSTASESALSAIALWRKHSERLPYLVVAGELHRPSGRVVGGLAGTWRQATGLFALSMARFCEISEAEGVDFSSGWLLFVTDERAQEVRSLMAEAQQVAGHS